MKPMKTVEAIRLLEQNGFCLIRSNGHYIYGCKTVRIALAHDKMVTAGVMRKVYRAIDMAKSENLESIA